MAINSPDETLDNNASNMALEDITDMMFSSLTGYDQDGGKLAPAQLDRIRAQLDHEAAKGLQHGLFTRRDLDAAKSEADAMAGNHKKFLSGEPLDYDPTISADERMRKFQIEAAKKAIRNVEAGAIEEHEAKQFSMRRATDPESGADQMRYDGYEVTGKTKQGHKIIQLTPAKEVNRMPNSVTDDKKKLLNSILKEKDRIQAQDKPRADNVLQYLLDRKKYSGVEFKNVDRDPYRDPKKRAQAFNEAEDKMEKALKEEAARKLLKKKSEEDLE